MRTNVVLAAEYEDIGCVGQVAHDGELTQTDELDSDLRPQLEQLRRQLSRPVR
jgi:hypothetical protein